MTAVKLVNVALLGATGTGEQSLAQALSQVFASTPLRWQITTDTPLQRLLQRDNADIDTESTEFKAALEQQRGFDRNLLLGLGVAPSTRAVHPESAAESSRMDTLLRHSLTQGNVPFQVIYGVGNERLRQALTALSALKLPETKPEAPPDEISNPRKPWVWACEKCSDPACEHRLLSDLLLNR